MGGNLLVATLVATLVGGRLGVSRGRGAHRLRLVRRTDRLEAGRHGADHAHGHVGARLDLGTVALAIRVREGRPDRRLVRDGVGAGRAWVVHHDVLVRLILVGHGGEAERRDEEREHDGFRGSSEIKSAFFNSAVAVIEM